MTPEELKRRRDTARLKDRRDDAVADTKESDMPATDKVRGGLQSYLKGSLMGFGDEVVGAGRAMVDYLMPETEADRIAAEFGGEEQSPTDRYAMYRDDERDVTKQFEEDYGKTAMALNLVGGALSPVNYVAPGLGVGGRGGAAALRSGLEGGLQGLGEGEGSFYEQIESLKSGAAWGVGTNIGLRVLGKAASKIAKRRVDEDLVDPQTGRRKPLHMTDGPLGDIYRKAGRVWGAQGKLKSQEQPFVDEAAEKLQRTSDDFLARKDIAADAYENRSAALVERAERAADDLDARAAQEVQAAKDAPAKVAAEQSANFRTTAARESLPAHAQGEIEGLDLANDVGAVRQRISSWWNKQGFREVKDRSFNLEGSRLRDELLEFMDNPEVRLDMADAAEDAARKRLKAEGPDYLDEQIARFTEIVGEGDNAKEVVNWGALLEAQLTEGAIDGNVLMALRNQFATGANKASGMSSGHQRQVANKFDEFIRSNLDEVSLGEFNDQIAKYTTALSYMGASGSKAARKAGGRFTPDQWLSSSGRYAGKGMSARQAPLEETAVRGQNIIDASAAESGDKLVTLKKTAAARKKAARRHAGKEKRGLTQTRRRQDRGFQEEARSGPVAQARQAAADLANKTLPDNTTILSDMLATSAAGGLVPKMPGEPSGRGRDIIKGLGVGRAIAADSTQDFLAGQTDWQKKLAKALREEDFATYNQILSRFSAGQAVGE